MSVYRKVPTAKFFATHAVFSLGEAADALAPPGGRRGTVERLKYHVEAGRLKRVARETYAVVPPGADPTRFQPDAFLVASTIRPDAVFSHHSALELLGAAHSTWSQVTVYAGHRRPLALNGVALRFLDHPAPLDSDSGRRFATRKVERRGRLLRTTGPERTLVEGLLRPELVGGLPELLASASGFAVLDLEVLEQTLTRYDTRKLWAAAGWFLDQFQRTFHVPEHYLQRLERFRPDSPRYLLRNDRGGTLVRRWNLIVPDTGGGEPDER
jgi:predicted transcriptional regulator of viral defense system